MTKSIFNRLLLFIIPTFVWANHVKHLNDESMLQHRTESSSSGGRQQFPINKDLSLLLLRNKPSGRLFQSNSPQTQDGHGKGLPSGFNRGHGGNKPVFQSPPQRIVPPVNHHQNDLDQNDHTNFNDKGKEEKWPIQYPSDTPKIIHLDVKCEKNYMKVSLEFDKVFNGLVFSKGHYNYRNCIYLAPNSGQKKTIFDIAINSCGTTGNAQGTYYNEDVNSDSGLFFENTIIIQYDPQVQEAWDQARKLRCTWHDQYEKSVSFRSFPVDMLEVVKADFAGDNVGCWMQIQVGKGPWASEVAGIVKIGQTMTMVLAIKDEENKFDMLVRNCIAHDGKRAPIELVDGNGCVVRPKIMTKFTKIKNFGSSASVLSYTHFQAFKFPDSMEVHFQCTIQICKSVCPDQCSKHLGSDAPLYNEDSNENKRKRRDISEFTISGKLKPKLDEKEVGLNKAIQVVSPRDLSFPINSSDMPVVAFHNTDAVSAERSQLDDSVCVSTFSLLTSIFCVSLVCLVSIFIVLTLKRNQINAHKLAQQTHLANIYMMK